MYISIADVSIESWHYVSLLRFIHLLIQEKKKLTPVHSPGLPSSLPSSRGVVLWRACHDFSRFFGQEKVVRFSEHFRQWMAPGHEAFAHWRAEASSARWGWNFDGLEMWKRFFGVVIVKCYKLMQRSIKCKSDISIYLVFYRHYDTDAHGGQCHPQVCWTRFVQRTWTRSLRRLQLFM